MDVLDRFLKYVEVQEDGCWRWTGGLSNGYGTFRVQTDRSVYAHRFSYETFMGAIPDGRMLDHICLFKACVNPNHLDPATAAINNRRARHLGDQIVLPISVADGRPYERPASLLLTVEEAADLLGIGRTLFYRLVGDGEIKTVKIGRLRKVPATALDDYLARLVAAS